MERAGARGLSAAREAEIRGWARMVGGHFATLGDATAWIRMQLPKVEAAVAAWSAEQPSPPVARRRRAKVQERLWAFLGQERKVATSGSTDGGRESDFERRMRLDREERRKTALRELESAEGQRIVESARSQARRLGLLREPADG